MRGEMQKQGRGRNAGNRARGHLRKHKPSESLGHTVGGWGKRDCEAGGTRIWDPHSWDGAQVFS